MFAREDAIDVKEAAAIRIQKLYRRRAARFLTLQLANAIYRKCYDESTGLYYYCNLKTGETAWERPKIFGNEDAPTFEEAIQANIKDSTRNNEMESLPAANDPVPEVEDAATQIQLDKARKAKIKEDKEIGLKLIQLQAQAKQDLERQNRKKMHQGRKNWDKCVKSELQQAREVRLQAIESENKRTLQDFIDGRAHKPQVESIREACMHGHIDRVETLLAEGWSPNAESAMGLTPLFAACIGGHVEIVKLLLQRGAQVNHRHIVTQRTAYMEACQRPNANVVLELLRWGAGIEWKDKQGRMASDSITSKKVQALHIMASSVWTPSSSLVFPNAFRAASLALAFISKCQRCQSIQRRKDAIKVAKAKRLELQKRLVQAKVQYDHDLKQSKLQLSLPKRRDATASADERFDQTRDEILKDAEQAALALHRASQPAFFTEGNLLIILSFCQRHWFDSREPRRQSSKPNARICLAPTRRWISSAVLPTDLSAQLEKNSAEIKTMSVELQELEETETINVDAGVYVKSSTAESTAEVTLTVVEAVNLPKRPHNGLIDPFVRARLHDEHGRILCEFEATEPRFQEESPSWDFEMKFHAVPTIRCVLHVQLMDLNYGRPEKAGEVSIALRQYVDQKDHDEWHILPPTLKQTLVEADKPRKEQAKLRLIVRFQHAKNLILMREIAKASGRRQELLQLRRQYIQDQLTRVLTLLEPKQS
ncbi:hypothetical protein AeNC1_000132 [Aphanomyces euteiches]|nr:hypothetical protein AeNC1_000132 [Aphanomyces euteiches]